MKTSHPTLCILPWASLSIGTRGEVLRCQMSREWMGHLGDSDIDEILENQKFSSLRKTMRAGEWELPEDIEKGPPGCSPCHRREMANFKSRRKHWMEEKTVKDLWAKDDFFTPQYQSVYHLDIAFNNLCNFKCRMCNSAFSSKWAPDEIFLKENGFKLKDKSRRDPILARKEPLKPYNIVEKLRKISPQLKTLRRVELVGGEPFINPDFDPFIDLLESLEVKKNCEIMITTNGSKLDEKNLSKLVGFKYVLLNISIDATGYLFEYMRSASETSWDEITARVKLALEFCEKQNALGNGFWKVNLNGAFQSINMLNFFECMSWIIETLKMNETTPEASKMRNSFEFRLLLNPDYLNALYAPAAMKIESLKQFEQLMAKYPWLTNIREYQYLKDIKNLLLKPEEDAAHIEVMRSEFRMHTRLLDKKREQEEKSFLKTYEAYL